MFLVTSLSSKITVSISEGFSAPFEIFPLSTSIVFVCRLTFSEKSVLLYSKKSYCPLGRVF